MFYRIGDGFVEDQPDANALRNFQGNGCKSELEPDLIANIESIPKIANELRQIRGNIHTGNIVFLVKLLMDQGNRKYSVLAVLYSRQCIGAQIRALRVEQA